MKGLMITVFLLLTQLTRAQEVAVCTDQTVTIIFPVEITHVDRGHDNVLVQLVPGAKMILLVKARTAQMSPTNITAVTTDGNVYVFRVVYNESPVVFIVQATMQGVLPVEQQCRQLHDRSMELPLIRDEVSGVSVKLSGLFIRDQTLFIQLRWRNESPLNYPVSALRLYIRDRQRPRRTAVQEVSMELLGAHLLPELVPAYSFSQSVIAVPARSLGSQQRLVIEVNEPGGARTLRLSLWPTLLLQAERLPPL